MSLHVMPLGWEFFVTLLVLELYWLAQVWASIKRELFTLKKAQGGYPNKKVLPFVWHFCCMWSDPIIMAPLLSYIVQLYWSWWRHRPEVVLLAALIGIVLGARMQWKWSQGRMDEAHTNAVAKLPSSVGIIHIMQIQTIAAILLLFVFTTLTFSGRVTANMFFGVALVCTFHFVLASHWPLRFKRLSWTPKELAPMEQLEAAFSIATSLIGLPYGIFLIVAG